MSAIVCHEGRDFYVSFMAVPLDHQGLRTVLCPEMVGSQAKALLRCPVHDYDARACLGSSPLLWAAEEASSLVLKRYG